MKPMFIFDVEAKLLAEENRKQFHTNTAKLLYIEQVRLDILTAVSFFCVQGYSQLRKRMP
jgi:hypothetical protein